MPRHNTLLSGFPCLKCDLFGGCYETSRVAIPCSPVPPSLPKTRACIPRCASPRRSVRPSTHPVSLFLSYHPHITRSLVRGGVDTGGYVGKGLHLIQVKITCHFLCNFVLQIHISIKITHVKLPPIGIPIKLSIHFQVSDYAQARSGQYNRLWVCKAKAFERERGGKISVFFRVKLRP